MKYNKSVKPYHRFSFLLTLGLSLSALQNVHASNLKATYSIVALDSIGNEIKNGERYVIHKLAPKETYYQLGRIYNISVSDIIKANNNKSLRVGDSVRIPRGKVQVAKSETQILNTTANKNNAVLVNPQEITEYKVGKSETLYAISRRFGISVDDIKKVNNLKSDVVKEGQLLKIPNNPLTPEPPVVLETPPIIEERQPIDDSMFKSNKYGIREKKERGVGVWLESLSDGNNTSLALHKFAPIGTILKITNPMNQSVTFAKVVGKFGDNENTQDAIVVLSKSVATSIGVLDRKFQVEIAYGIPLD